MTTFAVAQEGNLSADEIAIASNIKALGAENGDIRSAAAEALRRIVTKYPSGNTNIRSKDGGKAFWTERVAQIVPGMTKAEVDQILPHFGAAPETSGVWSGQTHFDSYRLDYDWVVRISYSNPDKVIDRPVLIARELAIYVPPPDDYTGTWTCWHVNGQRSYQIQFENGKYEGIFTRFHDNGQKVYEQHYTAHGANGSDTGWYPDGKIMYTGQYKNGKQDGHWIHFYPNGKKSSEGNYRNGQLDGLSAQWYENGQMRLEMHYINGVQNGPSAAWNETGILQYRRDYKDGKVIE